mmetsp:Transcript_25072/g.58703  ORF Transcript_25072/g.58703 Transcript_25072/m.58703 type:complete len:247 (-) Transcript_25072:456-1196(-)
MHATGLEQLALFLKYLQGVLVQLHVQLVFAVQQIPGRAPLLYGGMFVLVAVIPVQVLVAAVPALRTAVGKAEVGLEPAQRFGLLLHQTDDAVRAKEFLGHIQMSLGEVAGELAGQESDHPIVLHPVRSGVHLHVDERQVRVVSGLPIRDAQVVEHRDGPFDWMPDSSKHSRPVSLVKEGRDGRVDVRRDDHVSQLRLDEAHAGRPLQTGEGGGVDVDVSAALGQADDSSGSVAVVAVARPGVSGHN